MSTFKYVCAVFLRLNDLEQEDAAVMGWIMVMLDVVFMLGSVVAFVLIVVLLRASVKTVQGENQVLGVEENDGGGRRVGASRSLVKVVPRQQEEVEQQKVRLKKEVAALKWQKNIRQTLAKNNNPSTTSGFFQYFTNKSCFTRTDISLNQYNTTFFLHKQSLKHCHAHLSRCNSSNKTNSITFIFIACPNFQRLIN